MAQNDPPAEGAPGLFTASISGKGRRAVNERFWSARMRLDLGAGSCEKSGNNIALRIGGAGGHWT